MSILTTTILTLLFTSADALQAACPNLAGSYTCHQYGMRISQSMDGEGVTTYSLSYRNSDGVMTSFLTADGVYRNRGDWRFNGSCDENDTLRTHGIGDKYDIRATYSITGGGSLMTKAIYENKKTGTTKNYTITCAPKTM